MKFSAAVLISASLYLAGAGVWVILGGSAITSGAWLLQGMETMGAYIFFITALVTAAVGCGLLREATWARRAGIVLAAWFAFSAIPGVSAALGTERVTTILGQGAKLVIAAILIQRLWPRAARISIQG